MYKIVIVGDDELTLKKYASAYNWEEMGFNVTGYFSNEKDCLSFVSHNNVDVLLTDIFVAGLSGIELAEKCLRKKPNMGVIFISACSDFKYVRRALQLNVFDYILKPVNQSELESALSRLREYLDKLSGVAATNDFNSKNKSIKKIYEYVQKNYHKDLNVSEVSEYAMINPQYFSSFFKKHTGEGFLQFLRKYRLGQACKMLKDSDEKISLIAEQVGYRTTTHFYTHFSNEYGVTPSEYRQASRK